MSRLLLLTLASLPGFWVIASATPFLWRLGWDWVDWQVVNWPVSASIDMAFATLTISIAFGVVVRSFLNHLQGVT